MRWIKIIILCCVSLITGCRKTYVEPEPQKNDDIFLVKEVLVSNGDLLKFNIKSSGIYTLTLFDSIGQQVLIRERIVGKIGQNAINIYTKSLSARYLYLSLEDENNALIGKTMVVIK